MDKTEAGKRYPIVSSVMNMVARYCWIIGVLICVGVIWILGPKKIWSTFSVISPGLLFLLLLIQFLADIGRASKWYYVLGKGSNAIGLYFLSKAGGYWTPGRVGELSPLMLRQHRTPRMGAWLVVDRLLETTVTLLLGAGGLIFLGADVSGVYIKFAVVMCILILMAAFIITRQGLFRKLSGHLHEGSLLHRIAMFLDETTDEVLLLKWKLPVSSLLTIVFKILDVAVWVFVYSSLGAENRITFSLAAVAMCLGGLIGSIPITPVLTAVPYLVQGALIVEIVGIDKEVVVVATAIHFAVTNTVFWSLVALGTYDLRKRGGSRTHY